MLPSRSARLAATLLLALLLGWTIRHYRKAENIILPPQPPLPTARQEDIPKNSFPDE